MMNGSEDYDNALMEEQNILIGVKSPIEIESFEHPFVERNPDIIPGKSGR
jgi:hypothetical protein